MSCMKKPELIGPLLGYCNHRAYQRMEQKLRRYGVTPIQCRSLPSLHRPQAPCRDLGDDLACRLLRQAGYPCGSCGQCVARLVQRLRTEEDFPHEVGLFLSYPPEDVQGFIDHRAMDFKCAGLWKVYGDQQRAQALFDRFRRCTPRYCALWQTGLRLEQLAVAV